MLWPANASVFQINQLFDLLPKCSGEEYDIAGYPEYGTLPLEEDQTRVIKTVAQKIVTSQSTNAPYVAFIVVGHADTALRKPPNERAEFEQQVSEQRADAARNALLTEIMKLKDGDKVAKKILYKTRGEGSKYLLYRPTPGRQLSLSEMKANRRVEIFLAQCLLPEPPKPDPSDTLESRVNRLLKLVASKGLPNAPEHRTKRAPCVLNKLLKPGVVDTFVDGKATSVSGVGRFRVISNEGRACFLCEWSGNYDTPNDPLPQTEVDKFLFRIIPIIQAEGFTPSQPDEHVLMLLNEVLMRIDMGINQVDLYVQKNSAWVNPVTGYGYSGDAIRLRLQKMYRDHLNDENNIYSCGGTRPRRPRRRGGRP
jgi:hypothetical protein